MNKRKINYMNYVVAVAWVLAMVCFAISGYARYKYHEYPEEWIDGIVGMGMGSGLFLWGVPFLSGSFMRFKPGEFPCARRFFVFLGGGAFTTLGVILFLIGLERFLSDYPF